MEIAHGAVERNRALLAACAREAAEAGARLIVAPELAVSGYSFSGPEAVAPYAEELGGETCAALAAVAATHGVYICAGFAEREPDSGILYNSAFAVGPDGRLAAHHRKRVCERRWASPGSSGDPSVFETPWGRVGMLICADTYYGILSRSLALNGVGLLLVPANWPQWGMDPRELWRARCLENGFGVVSANRTGRDLTMDCCSAPSFALAPDGRVLLDAVSAETRIHYIDYPLSRGRFCAARSSDLLASRSPREYRDVCLDINGIDDLGTLWGLPEAGPLRVCVLAGREDGDGLLAAFREQVLRCGEPAVIVLPAGVPLSAHALRAIISFRPVLACAQVHFPGEPDPCLAFVGENQMMRLPHGSGSAWMDFGPARIALASPEALRHPEQSLALSKRGCDLLVTCGERLSADDRLVMGVKCIDRVVVAMAAGNAAAIYRPPVGHSRWEVADCPEGGECHALIDTTTVRRKHFMDRVDMGALLRTG